MVEEELKRRGVNRGFRWRGIAAAVVVSVVLGGCSSVPDAVNPVKWYENTVDLFSGDEEQAQTAAKPQPAPGGDEAFPNLGTVPDRPQTSNVKEREQIAEGLVADRENRRYAPTISRQAAPTNVLGDTRAAAAVPETPAGAVPALPATPSPIAPVQTAPVPKPATVQPSQPMAAAPTQMAATPPPAPRVSLEPPPMPARPATAGAMPQSTDVAPRMAQPIPPANAAMPSAGSFDTVVISSSGIEEGVSGASQPAPVAAPRFAPELAMAPRPSPRKASGSAAGGRTGNTGSMKVATIQFASGSATLDSRDRAILRNVVALQSERGGTIRVVGHASARTVNMDPVRHTMVNYQVSVDRAQNIAQELIGLGAGSDTVVVTAKSDSEPVYFEFMPSGEAGNRRAEIFLDF